MAQDDKKKEEKPKSTPEFPQSREYFNKWLNLTIQIEPQEIKPPDEDVMSRMALYQDKDASLLKGKDRENLIKLAEKAAEPFKQALQQAVAPAHRFENNLEGVDKTALPYEQRMDNARKTYDYETAWEKARKPVEEAIVSVFERNGYSTKMRDGRFPEEYFAAQAEGKKVDNPEAEHVGHNLEMIESIISSIEFPRSAREAAEKGYGRYLPPGSAPAPAAPSFPLPDFKTLMPAPRARGR